jgi:UDP-glucose 4-epimerase
MAKILVTGGAGFIGSNLARGLIDMGRSVRVLDNLSTGNQENLDGLDIDLQIGDIRKSIDLDRALKDVEVVFHLGAYVSAPGSVREPGLCYDVNIIGSLNLLRTAHQTGAKRVILASSAAIYGDSPEPVSESRIPRCQSPYAVSKLSMEETAKVFTREYGLETVCLRFFNVFGPRQDPNSPYAAVIPEFINQLEVGNGITIHGDGQQTRDFVHVDDVVQACLLAMEDSSAVGESINIAGGGSISILELARILQGFYPEAPEVQFGAPRAGDVRFSQANISKAKEALGYRPKIELEEGLRRTVEWFKISRR